jgi:hypothetical protein
MVLALHGLTIPRSKDEGRRTKDELTVEEDSSFVFRPLSRRLTRALT